VLRHALAPSAERSRRTRERQRLGLPPALEPKTLLGRVLWDLSRAERVAIETLTVLHPARDPFRLDTPAGHKNGQWFAAQIARLVPHGTVHLRGLHYRITAAAHVVKPNGERYVNNEADWVWLVDTASKAARWLGYVPFDRIVDERNEEPEVWEADPVVVHHANIEVDCPIELPEPAEVLPQPWCSRLAGQQPCRIIPCGESRRSVRCCGRSPSAVRAN
jgi:hypothetical protein